MKKIKFCAALVYVAISLTFSGCYQAPSANGSRNSSTATTDPTSRPTAEKTISSTPSTPAPPAKTGGGFEQALNDYNAKNLDRAETGFKEILEAEPNNAEAHYYLGNIYYRRQQFETALPHFERAAKTDGKAVDKLMALGETQRALKQFDRAIVQYQKVIGFDPNNANAYYGLGLTYIGLNNKIGARQQLQKLEPLNKNLANNLQKEIESLK
jgi:tetratricopeptide (TPR) repeat protein